MPRGTRMPAKAPECPTGRTIVTKTLASPTPAYAGAAGEPTVHGDGKGLLAMLAELPADDSLRPALRERTIAAFAPMARRLAHRYDGRGESLDDLVQTAMVGLIKAVDRFDAGRGVDFVGFAVPTIVGEIKRHFRDRTWDVRVPRRLQELRLAISEASSVLPHRLGRSPTVMDIAAHLGLTEEEVLEGLESARAYNCVSLSAPVSADDGGTELSDMLGGPDREFELAELRMALGPAIASLDRRQQTILVLRFYGNLTQAQIAERIGVSQMHVSRLLTKALAKLRGQFADTG
jgi:RNA polymerase sigma-B factor